MLQAPGLAFEVGRGTVMQASQQGAQLSPVTAAGSVHTVLMGRILVEWVLGLGLGRKAAGEGPREPHLTLSSAFLLGSIDACAWCASEGLGAGVSWDDGRTWELLLPSESPQSPAAYQASKGSLPRLLRGSHTAQSPGWPPFSASSLCTFRVKLGCEPLSIKPILPSQKHPKTKRPIQPNNVLL